MILRYDQHNDFWFKIRIKSQLYGKPRFDSYSAESLFIVIFGHIHQSFSCLSTQITCIFVFCFMYFHILPYGRQYPYCVTLISILMLKVTVSWLIYAKSRFNGYRVWLLYFVWLFFTFNEPYFFSSFKFTAKYNRKYRESPYAIPCSRTRLATPVVNILHDSGPFWVVSFLQFLCLVLSERACMRVSSKGAERERRKNPVLSAQSLRQDLVPWTVRSWPELRSRLGCWTNWATQAPWQQWCVLYGHSLIIFRQSL